MNRIIIGAVAASALLLAGCSSSAPESEPTPTPTQATIGQFASVVARNSKPIRTIAEDRADCYLDIVLGDSRELAQSCVDAASDGRFAVVEIGNKFTELGTPPAEIDDLAQRMIRAGTHLATTPELDVEANCTDTQSDDCAAAVAAVMQSLKEVILPELDAWQPYL